MDEEEYICLHTDLDNDGTCMLCGECDIKTVSINDIANNKEFCVRSYVKEDMNRRLLHFNSIMDIKSGKQSIKLKQQDFTIIRDMTIYLYGDNFTERCIRSVLKKLKLNKYLNDSYLIYCVVKNIECERFTQYESFFEFLFTKMYKQYCLLYPRKYFINSSYILSMFLQEVGNYNHSYQFKNIDTFTHNQKIYNQLRRLIPITYNEFVSGSKII